MLVDVNIEVAKDNVLIESNYIQMNVLKGYFAPKSHAAIVQPSTYLHVVMGEVHGNEVGVEEEVLWDLLQIAVGQVSLKWVLGHHLGMFS